MGSRCLFVMRVKGYRREPVPPARMTPFTTARPALSTIRMGRF